MRNWRRRLRLGRVVARYPRVWYGSRPDSYAANTLQIERCRCHYWRLEVEDSLVPELLLELPQSMVRSGTLRTRCRR